MEIILQVATLIIVAVALFLIYRSQNRFEKELIKELREQQERLTAQLKEQSNEQKEYIKGHSDLVFKLKESQEKFSKSLNTTMQESFEKLTTRVDAKLDLLSNRVDERLKKGFDNVDKTFKDILTSVARIGEAQKKIEALSTNVVSLQDLLSDKKSRGIFGEVQLNQILKTIFGEKEHLYATQYNIDIDGKKVIADAIIKVPQPVGMIAIDSKFPLENYTRIMDSKDNTEKTEHIKAFRTNLKKHINDIADKYIIQGTTAEIAIMFLPAEAIFAEVHAHHSEIIEAAQKRNVWIASPTTLMALLTTVQAIVRDIKTQEQAKTIQAELMKLSNNFRLYKDRWEKLAKDVERVNKDVKDISVTSEKISKEFSKIEQVEFEEEVVKLT